MRGVRCLLLPWLLLLGACHGGGSIESARIVRTPEPVLDASLRLRPSTQMLAALDRGVALTLRLRLRTVDAMPALDTSRRIELRYLPLAQQYQLRDLDSGQMRYFARQPQLLAALDRVRLPLDASWAGLADGTICTLALALDVNALPAPLRLPALLSSSWRMNPPEHRWTAGS
jgi:hypothetical protein